ncbi:citrate/tricarballylate utilization protein [Rhodoblastus acidophilus]|uniref:tricarballylate utilization 4Fe-4S protein TcuB n=1 Tax=Rhodoblastus acidophilus TaxID=1074 RepID=UPI002224573B|nr:tricarballylate utilization 4Fe-4S protein TcuB [Rhodoblastus acidophilus]MCW2282503.1 citrate/tricarballylate utilization protein [Rhodoblastus acidophilus]MCW2331364.1 citrate/tricarballylate utilization protein [Rhodoblastus acidophilus]
MSSTDEADRILRICAACMYCDGLCPVFPALAGQRDDFGDAYLANLCHNCRACWHACQYAPPHPFAVNAPAVLARVRRQTYADHVWPRVLRHGFERPALGAVFLVAAALLTLAMLTFASSHGQSGFYSVVPWGVMAGLGGGALTFATISMAVSTLRFWRTISADLQPGRLGPALWRAAMDIVTLRHLDGGGPGCHDIGPGFSRSRKIFHHLMAGGVLLAFASTLVAAAYEHFWGLSPPFPLASPPVLLGLAGGLGIVAGAAGLLALETRMEREVSEPGETQLNVIFLIALQLVALSGLALLFFRDTPAMGPLLLGHLSLVTGFFLALPATKALHAPFRAAALLRHAFSRTPKTRAVASD